MGRTFGPVARGHGSNSRSGRNFRRSPELNPRPWNFPKKSCLSAARGGASESSTRDLPMGLGQKGNISPLDSFLSISRLPGRVSNHFPKSSRIFSRFVQIRPDSYPILSDLVRSCFCALRFALTLSGWPCLVWAGDFDRRFFHLPADSNPRPGQGVRNSLPAGPIWHCQFGGRPPRRPRKWYSLGAVAADFDSFPRALPGQSLLRVPRQQLQRRPEI